MPKRMLGGVAASAIAFFVVALTVLVPNSAGASQNDAAQARPTPTAFRYLTPTPVTFAVPQPTLGPGAVTLSGTVHDADLTPLPNALVGADTATSHLINTSGGSTTDAAGRFQFPVPGAVMAVFARHDGFTQRTIPVIDTSSGPNTAVQDIVLYRNDATLTGTVVDGATDGRPPEAGTVSVYVSAEVPFPSQPDWVSVAGGSVMADGTYGFSAAAGEYPLITASQTTSSGYGSRGDTEAAPYSLNAGDNAPVSFVLPALVVETPGCSSPACTLSVSGGGWLPGDNVALQLVECGDEVCSFFSTSIDVGSVQVDADGTINPQSVDFAAPPSASYAIYATNSVGPAVPSGRSVTTLRVYVVAA